GADRRLSVSVPRRARSFIPGGKGSGVDRAGRELHALRGNETLRRRSAHMKCGERQGQNDEKQISGHGRKPGSEVPVRRADFPARQASGRKPYWVKRVKFLPSIAAFRTSSRR